MYMTDSIPQLWMAQSYLIAYINYNCEYIMFSHYVANFNTATTYTFQSIVSGVTAQDGEALCQDTSVRYLFR